MVWICKDCKKMNLDVAPKCAECKIDRFEQTTEDRVNNSTYFKLIDAAAKAWADAGGDADGVESNWHHIRDRVGELS